MTTADPASGDFAAPQARFYLTLTQVTSVVLLTTRRALRREGSVAELEAFYRQVRNHNLAAGWWGIPAGPIWTLMWLRRNAKALAKLKQLAADDSNASAGWLPDPSGRHTQRYWDGHRWTDQVSDTTTTTDPS
jgi:hypothetical protein